MSTPAHVRAEPDFLALFATAARRFGARLREADPRAAVPTCPGWDVLELAVHLGNVHAWAATVVETGRAAPAQDDRPGSRRPATVASWYDGKAGDLYAVLRSTAGDRPCWNFSSGEGEASFWSRRQVHETVVHGMDLELASGLRPEIAPDVAADGIDEALRLFLRRMHDRGHPARLTAPVDLVAADVGRSWTVHPGAGGTVPLVSEGDGPPSAERIEGPAAAVYALLWKRLPATDAALGLAGDQARIAAFLGSRLTA